MCKKRAIGILFKVAATFSGVGSLSSLARTPRIAHLKAPAVHSKITALYGTKGRVYRKPK
jgi:hypothetical protein